MFKNVLLLGVLVSALSACNPKKPNPELVHDMLEQPALKAQDFHPNDRDSSSMRVPPEGTVPRGFKPYLYTDPVEAGRNLRNPIAGEEVSQGKVYYDRYCLVCHGSTGAGDGPVAEKFGGMVKSLLTSQVKSWPDGRIFHVISAGQGVMGSYLNQLPNEKDRWHVVNYVRHLQKAEGN